MVKGTTGVLGIIGNPVAHSISPLLHNMLADLTGLDLVYVPFPVEKGEVQKAVEGAYALHIAGMNVTVPHKSDVISALVDIDPLAEHIGAVNTLVRSAGGYKGYNTDILGLKRELEEEEIPLQGENVILLGSGGAARAIAFLCAAERAKHIYILNRTFEKAQDIASAVNQYYGAQIASAHLLKDYGMLQGQDYIAIQTTSVGLYPNVNEAPITDEAFYQKIKAGVDIIYNPAKTHFMKLLENAGGRAYNGLKMLLYQGVSAFELWNDIQIGSADTTAVYEAMKRELQIV